MLMVNLDALTGEDILSRGQLEDEFWMTHEREPAAVEPLRLWLETAWEPAWLLRLCGLPGQRIGLSVALKAAARSLAAVGWAEAGPMAVGQAWSVAEVAQEQLRRGVQPSALTARAIADFTARWYRDNRASLSPAQRAAAGVAERLAFLGSMEDAGSWCNVVMQVLQGASSVARATGGATAVDVEQRRQAADLEAAIVEVRDV